MIYEDKISRPTLNEQNIYGFMDWATNIGGEPTYMLRILEY